MSPQSPEVFPTPSAPPAAPEQWNTRIELAIPDATMQALAREACDADIPLRDYIRKQCKLLLAQLGTLQDVHMDPEPRWVTQEDADRSPEDGRETLPIVVNRRSLQSQLNATLKNIFSFFG